MNREIKFRGISKLTGQWIEGSLVIHTDGECSIIDYADAEFQSYTWNDVIRETVGEFTGRKDKNSKEIYDGDIIETDNSSYFKIIWDNDIMGFKLTYDGLGDKGWFHVIEGHGGIHTWSVVGNIYQNN
jgi:uncharacterized phage protein (TIGR01671 family)